MKQPINEIKRMQQLAGISLNENEQNEPISEPYKYCWISSHEDYKELCIATNSSYNKWLKEMADENDTNVEDVMSWAYSDYLKEIPNSPFIFIGWNDEGPNVYSFNNKEEFVNSIGLQYHDLFSQEDLPETSEYWDESKEAFTQKGVEEGYKILIEYIKNSEADGDSSEANMLIVNNKIIASGPYYEV
jgi:hypothetical protein